MVPVVVSVPGDETEVNHIELVKLAQFKLDLVVLRVLECEVADHDVVWFQVIVDVA